MDGEQTTELAWDVVERMRDQLTVAELNTVFVKLGADEPASAIETVLRRLAMNRAPIPDDLLPRLRRWVDAFEAHPTHARLSRLIDYAERDADG